MAFTPQERRELAAMADISEPYLYQCLTGRGAMRPEEAVRVERATNGRLRRWHLRPKDWERVWPELEGLAGSPDPKAREAVA